MKRTLVFIAVVLGYSLLELSVAWAIPVPIYSSNWNREPVLALLLLVLIPGLAAIFSGFGFGAGLWRKRALVTVATGAVGVPLLMAALFFYAFVLDWMFGVSTILGGLFACVLVGGTVWLLRVISRALRRWDSQLEVKSWLAGNQDYRLRQRAIRWALWIPSLMVLGIFTFFFEAWGMATHIAIPNPGEIAEYRFSIPMKWILLNHPNNRQIGVSGSFGITGTDVALALQTYRSVSAPISSWNIRTDECGSPPASKDLWVSGRQLRTMRTIGMGAAKFTCSEVWFSDKRWPVSAEVSVSCSGPERLNADYLGQKSELSAFYKMLGTLEYTGDAPPCPVTWQR